MAMQQSEEGATRNGVLALEQAFTGVQRCQQDVQSTAQTLASSYQGADGGKYKQLLEQWDGHVDTILLNLDRMVDQLNETLQEHTGQQGANNEAIDSAYSRATAVFDELNGTADTPAPTAGTNPLS
ncbi:WXG100 family type VII secretion target [Streptomyces sp. NPDC057245]|uniref:WXG100 family type VII secretion target n=1 Tax=Streptomyces TaxID=1883 RepID=UPI001C1E45D0|nr:WXG100 family type VII secretion target [Streptomyces sp. A108]MBU6533106.1 hypothetical protein [Streptomyces sp. A108]